jgi:hypothetical protein
MMGMGTWLIEVYGKKSRQGMESQLKGIFGEVSGMDDYCEI